MKYSQSHEKEEDPLGLTLSPGGDSYTLAGAWFLSHLMPPVCSSVVHGCGPWAWSLDIFQEDGGSHVPLPEMNRGDVPWWGDGGDGRIYICLAAPRCQDPPVKHIRVTLGLCTLHEINMEISKLALHALGVSSTSVKGPKKQKTDILRKRG